MTKKEPLYALKVKRTGRMKQLIFFYLLLVCAAGIAQEPSIYSTVSKNPVPAGERFSVTFVMENVDPQEFNPPTFDNLQVMPGRSSSQSVQIVNGKVNRQVNYTYYLTAPAKGKYTIGSATMRVAGKTYKSKPITVEVTEGGSPNVAGSPQTLPTDNIFIRASLDKKEVYQGEQVLLTYKLYTRYNIQNYTPPTTKYIGFYKRDINIARPHLSREVINGKVYHSGIIHQVVLFPQNTGDLKLEPAEMAANVEIDFFRSSRVDLKGNPLSLHVKPLPDKGRPEDFTGAVGDFRLSTDISTTSTTTDEPITFKMTISGEGNLVLINAPKLSLPPDFEVYEPEVRDDISTAAGKMRGSKSFDYLIIPRRPGEYSLNEMTFNYFDPKKQRYIELKSESYTLDIQRGSGTSGDKSDVALLNEDIRYIKTNSNLRPKGEFLLTSPIFAGLMLAPILLFIPLIILKRKRERRVGDIQYLRNQKARQISKKRLAQAREFLKKNESRNFYHEIDKALYGYIEHRFGIHGKDLSKENIQRRLQEQNISPEIIENLVFLLNRSETAVFAPAFAPGDMQADYGQAETLIYRMESSR